VGATGTLKAQLRTLFLIGIIFLLPGARACLLPVLIGIASKFEAAVVGDEFKVTIDLIWSSNRRVNLE
jgi:hypothetical protein